MAVDGGVVEIHAGGGTRGCACLVSAASSSLPPSASCGGGLFAGLQEIPVVARKERHFTARTRPAVGDTNPEWRKRAATAHHLAAVLRACVAANAKAQQRRWWQHPCRALPLCLLLLLLLLRPRRYWNQDTPYQT